MLYLAEEGTNCTTLAGDILCKDRVRLHYRGEEYPYSPYLQGLSNRQRTSNWSGKSALSSVSYERNDADVHVQGDFMRPSSVLG